MSQYLPTLWQWNIEFSLLLCGVLAARFLLRGTTKNYNAYLLWLSIPVGILIATVVAQIPLAQPPAPSVASLVQDYVVGPAKASQDWGALGYLWVALTCVMLARLFEQHRLLRRDLRAISRPLPHAVESKYPVIGVAKENFSPAVYGFVQPHIYFPVQLLNELQPYQVALIVEHEEHHITQQHLWLNLLWDVLVCVLWFNPLVYWGRRSFRHDQELFCDYLVLHDDAGQKQQAYGHALLSTITATHSVSLLCSWQTFNQLEERIMNIKHTASNNSKLLMALCGLGIVAATATYGVSAHEATGHEKETKRVVKKIEMDDTDNKIELQLNDKIYVSEQGKHVIKEGQKSRPMTAAEQAEFEREIELIKSRTSMSFSGPLDKQITIMEADGISEYEIETMTHQMQDLEREMQLGLVDFDLVEKEVARALQDIEAAHASEEISAKAMRKARKQLKATQKSLVTDKQKMQRALDQARAEVQSLRAELEAKKAKAY